MAAQLVTIYWRDIPAQVTAQRGSNREKALLAARFQHAIDRAAMVAGCTDPDSYVAEWRREAPIRPVIFEDAFHDRVKQDMA